MGTFFGTINPRVGLVKIWVYDEAFREAHIYVFRSFTEY
jgi:hypothetical protein